MTDELAVCAAAYFRGIGKEVATSEEFVMGTSLELKWLSPSDARLLLASMVKAGTVTQKDGYIRPGNGVLDIDVPLAYRPSGELLDIIRGKTQTPDVNPRATSDSAPQDVFPKLMDIAASNGMERRDFIQSCNKIQKRLDIEVAVAALIVLRDSGVDVSPYLDDVYGSVKGL